MADEKDDPDVEKWAQQFGTVDSDGTATIAKNQRDMDRVAVVNEYRRRTGQKPAKGGRGRG